jgi:peptidoglycan pentaglycine glycine transferase (the first glycine)
MPVLTFSEWKQFTEQHPGGHLLQQAEWGLLKAGFGWQPVYLAEEDSGAQVLFRSLPLGFSIGYIPKGPLGSDLKPLWPLLDAVCQERRAVFLKVEPDAWDAEFSRAEEMLQAGFRPSRHDLQPRRTVVLDLRPEEEEILAGMKQKTRYNIRLAERKEVVVSPSADLDAFGKLIEVTGERDAFGVHTPEYYRQAYELFHPLGMCELLIASYQGNPLAGLMVFASGRRAWYLYGASNNQERNRMPTYLIQWEAIRWAKQKGCTSYDLWGVPDHEEETLEAQFSDHSDGLWGVYRFKRGFGGELMRTCGAWDKVYHRAAYLGYQVLMARRGQA